MHTRVLIAMMSVLMIVAPAAAQDSGKWVKRAVFPKPSEELVGASVDGKFYVFGGLGPGWIPQGFAYEYDPATDKWTKKKPMALSAPTSRLRNSMESSTRSAVLCRPNRGHLHGCRSITHGNMTRRTTSGTHWLLCR